jgi:hypothetical protein
VLPEMDSKDPIEIPLEVIRAFAERPRTQAVKVVIIEDLDSVRVDPAAAGREDGAGGPQSPPGCAAHPHPSRLEASA